MRIPAVILCDAASAPRRVAGLWLLDRLVVAAHRAGAEDITIVSEKPLARLERALALGIPVRVAAVRPELPRPTLVLSDRLLIQPADLSRLMERGGRLARPDGQPLPAGILTEFSALPGEDPWSGRPAILAQGVAEFVDDELGAARAGRALWASLGSATDGWVDRHCNRPVGRWLAKMLVHTSVSPNQVSVAAILLGLVAAALFAQGDYRRALEGAILLQVSAMVDCVDGYLARAMFKESRLGKWLDLAGDQVVNIAIFAGIGIGLARAGSSAPVAALAASGALGVVVSFVVVTYGQWQRESPRHPRLEKLIEATANRDFSVVLLLLAWLGKLPWFLWMAAIGVHAFWLLVLGVQWLNQPAAATLEPRS